MRRPVVVLCAAAMLVPAPGGAVNSGGWYVPTAEYWGPGGPATYGNTFLLTSEQDGQLEPLVEDQCRALCEPAESYALVHTWVIEPLLHDSAYTFKALVVLPPEGYEPFAFSWAESPLGPFSPLCTVSGFYWQVCEVAVPRPSSNLVYVRVEDTIRSAADSRRSEIRVDVIALIPPQ